MRIGLDGHGDPISTDPFASLAAARDNTWVNFLSDGEVFDPAPHIEAGRTQFEVTVIGASGGFGGGFGSRASFYYTQRRTRLPDARWTDFVLYVTKYFERLHGPDWWDDTVIHGSLISQYGLQPGVASFHPTIAQFLAARYSNHALLRRVATTDVTLVQDGRYWGGAPGGGGMQIVIGDLADLPEDGVPIVVGVAGANGALGQDRVHGLWTPDPTATNGSIDPAPNWTGFLNGAWGGDDFMNVADAVNTDYRIPGWPNSDWPAALAAYNNLVAWATSLPTSGISSFDNPQAGGDGGHSAFGDIAVASGGEGGAAAKVWGGSSFSVDGSGGDGGAGDSDVAGGGGAGGGGTPTAPTPGADGHYADGIGAGGGGGHTGDSTSHNGSYGGIGSLEAGSKRGPGGQANGVIPGAGGGAVVDGYTRGSRIRELTLDGAVFIRVT
jgi:hypothetical protein